MACAGMHPASASSRASGRARSAPALSRRACWAASVVLALIAVFGAPRAAMSDPIKASLSASTSDGYARLIFTMSDYDAASVRQAGSVLIIGFKEPIDVSVEKLAAQAPDYIGAARRDPDGNAVRLALAQKVRVNTITAGEQFFVDLLPESWSGSPPGLPQDVVEDLARRAHEAEQLVERERRLVALEKIPPVRVRVATEPTFTRYVFAIPDQISVATKREQDVLTLTFDAPLRFDLSDAEGALPATVGAIGAQLHDGLSLVHFDLHGKVEVRTFRDENGYAVDIVAADAKASAESPGFALPAVPAPAVAPSPAAPASAAAPPAASSPGAALPPAPTAAAPPVTKTEPVGMAAPAAGQIAPPAPAAAAPAAPAAATAAPQPAAQPTAQPVAATPASPAPAAASANPQAPAASKQAEPAPAAAATPASSPPAVASPAAANPAPAKPAAAAPNQAAKAPPAARSPANGKIPVELARDGVRLKLAFDFMVPTAAAVFDRADTLWLVFDAKDDIDLSALKDEASRTIRSAELIRAPDADIIRIKLDRPHLTSITDEGPVWVLEIGDSVAEPTHALDLERNLIGKNRSTMTIPLE
jgi:hypothetical protein